MRRSILAAILLAGVAALPSTVSQAQVSADINLHLGDRYPVYFRSAPRTYIVPNTDVYYMNSNDYDMFRYGNRWYINDGGAWFNATSYRGPFVRVAYQSVPRVILQVPPRYHRQTRGYWQSSNSYNHGWQGNNDGNWNNGNNGNNGNKGNSGHGHGNNGRGHGNGNGNGNDRDNDD